MKTPYLTILLLLSAIGITFGDPTPPVYIQTNGLNIVVRSPSFAITNHTMRPSSGGSSILSTQLSASNRLASAAASARSTAQPYAQRMQIASGSAYASFGLHKVGFAGSLVGAQPVSIATPDNQIIHFRPTLLAYYDTASGPTVPLAEIRDSAGGVLWPNNVIYTNTFSTLNADVQYICTPNSIEQNIVLRQCPPTPESFGLNPDTTRLEVWTEWFDPAPVRTQQSVITLRAGINGANTVTAIDTGLDFGTMKIVQGRAFALGGSPNAVPVAKEWGEVQGKKFLLESVDYRSIQQDLQTLTASITPSVRKTYASRQQVIDALPANVSDKSHPMQLANADFGQAKGVVLDFTIIDAIPLPAGAIEWWPAGGNANDVIGGYNGTMMNGATFAAGEVGQGFSVDGTSSYIKIPSSIDPTGPFSIEFWMKADPTNSMTSLQGLVTGDFYGIEISYGWHGNIGVNFFISPDSGSTWNMTSTPNGGGAAVSAGDWHHIAGTYDGTNMQLYVDGQVWGYSYPSAPAAPTQTGSFLTFGSEDGNGNPNRYFNGILDEVTIYNRALAPSEIQAIYNAGGAGKDNPNCVTPPSNAVGWWAGDGNANDLVNTNNGSLQGGATYSSGEVAQAFDLNGSSGYVQVPDNDAWAFGNNDFTIEFWVNFRSLPSYGSLYYPDAILVANDQGGGDQNKWIFDLGDGVLTLLTDDPVNWVRFFGHIPFTPDMNTWYHLAVVRQGTGITIYTNGVPAGTDTVTVPIANANAPLTIGQSEGLGYVNGQIDEMTIYNRALSGSEISAIYSAGGAGKCKTDLDHDGLPDWWELKYFGTLAYSGSDLDTSGIHTLLYDYQHGVDPTIFYNVRLGYWPFDNTTSWIGAAGQLPLLATNVVGVPSWSTNAALIDTNIAMLTYRDVEISGNANINLHSGTVRFWFSPDWGSTNAGGIGPQSEGRLIEMGTEGSTSGWWGLVIGSSGTNIYFGTQTNSPGTLTTNLTAAISMSSNIWHQIALTYSTNSSSLYLDGLPLLTNGLGITYWPGQPVRSLGFTLDGSASGTNQARDLFDELETFNYSLDPNTIATNYQAMYKMDRDGDGLPDIWEMEYFGHLGNDPNGNPSGDGAPNNWKAQLGLNPNINYGTSSGQRSNYGYTPADWLNAVSGIKGGSITNDPEGNVISVSQ